MIESERIVDGFCFMPPEFHREIGFPRTAAVEYPYGRPVGQVHDRQGQRDVLQAALAVFEKAQKPGQIFHLPFTWPEAPKDAKWHPPQISPVVKLFLAEIRKASAAAHQ